MVKYLLSYGTKAFIREFLNKIYKRSLQAAAKEQGLKKLVHKLEHIVPDITDQYSTFKIDTPYLQTKVRTMHAFQISLVDTVMGEIRDPVIVDIGDSAGTHIQYIHGLHSCRKNIKCMSINLDEEAVQRIKKKGIEAMLARAEDLTKYNINADVYLCFEILEHLMDPCVFLRELSKKNTRFLIVTVPYLKRSRVGLHHIRGTRKDVVNAENTHIFELSPEDWKLIVRHSGWNIVKEKIYLQYPLKGFLYITKPLWRKFDFEGFYGLVLERDTTWSEKYLDW